MGRRSDHSREELEQLALEAGLAAVREQGISGLTVRGVAQAIGYSPGTLYNLFENRDELILHVAGRTLDLLHKYIEPVDRAEGNQGLHDLCDLFIAFIDSQGALWQSVTACASEASTPPVWYWQKVLRLINLVADDLMKAAPNASRESAMKSALTLSISINGIMACATRVNLQSFAQASQTELAHDLIDRYVEGFQVQASTASSVTS